MADQVKSQGKSFDEIAFDNFFERFNLLDLKETFIQNGFRTCRSLMIVGDDDLKEIGIDSLGLRKELLGAVEEWKRPLMQRTSNQNQNKQPRTQTPVIQSPNPAQSEIKRSPEYSQTSQTFSQSSGQIQSPNIIRREGAIGTPILSPGLSPGLGANGDKFHRIKRNESCPYPECTWAGLSTHFHCLVCSNFHTNKTERIRRHIQRHEVGESGHELDEYQKVKRENFYIFGAKECPELCKYSEIGVRHLHCKHCDWRTKKIDQMRRHLKAHVEPNSPESESKLEEYYRVKEQQYVIYNKICPEMCKYAHQGIRHIHCKHCNWRTQKFDSRLLAHYKSHHERHILQYHATHGIESPVTTMAGMRTVSPLPTMAVQEASQVAEGRGDDSALPRPPKLMKMEMVEGEGAVQMHIQQQGSFLNRPNIGNEDEGGESAAMIENEMQPNSKYKCMVCGVESQSLRSSLMREQKGRNGPVDWNKTKQLFSYHHIKTTQPANHWICQKHIEEFVYFSRAYLTLWNTSNVHHQHSHVVVTHANEGDAENALVQGMPVYMMLNEHLNEQYKQENEEVEEETEAGEPE